MVLRKNIVLIVGRSSHKSESAEENKERLGSIKNSHNKKAVIFWAPDERRKIPNNFTYSFSEERVLKSNKVYGTN